MVGNWRLDNVSNYEASVDVDFDDAELDDMSGGDFAGETPCWLPSEGQTG